MRGRGRCCQVSHAEPSSWGSMPNLEISKNGETLVSNGDNQETGDDVVS